MAWIFPIKIFLKEAAHYVQMVNNRDPWVVYIWKPRQKYLVHITMG